METVYGGFYILPEETLEEAIKELGTEDNSFKKILKVVNEYKKAEMSPMVLYDSENSDLYVVAKETWMKKLH